MSRPRIEFWHELASTYSYLSALRIEPLAEAAGCDVVWRPFLLGPIFKAQGWATSPFNLYPAKGRYMVRDIERIAAARGRTFRLPATFPAASLLASRLVIAAEEAVRPAVTKAIYVAEFEAGADIADRPMLETVLGDCRFDATAMLARADSAEVKAELRANTETAMTRGLFGAPTFVTADGELFWGDDRLEQALAWAAGKARC